jgi:hypothetical protein
MKKIPKNVWRTRLNETDWNFAQVFRGHDELAEIQDCLQWELSREIVQSECGGTLPGNPLNVALNYQDSLRMSFWRDSEVEQCPCVEWHDALRKLKKVPKVNGWIYDPAFPQLSYFESREKQKWKRMERIKPAMWVHLDCNWHEYFADIWSELEEAVRCRSPLMWPGSTTELVPLAIPWGWRDEYIVEAFREWLKERRPTGEDDRPRVDEPPAKPKDKGGQGSPIRQAKSKLKALAAWRLIQHYGGNRVRAYGHPGADKYLGEQFETAGAWSEARATVLSAADEKLHFYQSVLAAAGRI